MKMFEELLNEKDYLIKSVIKKLNIYTNYNEFYHLGTIALYHAVIKYDITKDKYKNFDLFAYYFISNYLKNELKKINRYQKIEIIMDLHQNEYLAPIIEEDLIRKIEFEDLTKNLTNIQKRIMKYKNLGYKHNEIAKLLNCNEEQIKYQLKLAFNIVRSTLHKININ